MVDKFIFWSDLHIHDHGKDSRRIEDALKVLSWIKAEAIARGIKKIFFLGDWFHSRSYLYPEVVAKTYEVLLDFKASGIDMTLLVGNHDMPYRDTTKENSLTAFKSIVDVVDEPAIYEGKNFDFYLMPYVENPQKLLWGIDKMLSGQEDSRNTSPCTKPRVLLAHLDINSALQSSRMACTQGIDPDLLTQKFDMIVTGHYHINQTLRDKIYYIGSPYQQEFGESGQKKGFYVFDDGELTYVENTFSPEYVYIQPKDISGKAVYDNYVRIEAVTGDNLAEIREKMNSLHARSFSINVQPDKSKSRDLQIENVRDVKDLLMEWVEKNADPEVYDLKKLYDLGIGMANV
jgi:DNA repair exonuclease SbcCD nuclease subunit